MPVFFKPVSLTMMMALAFFLIYVFAQPNSTITPIDIDSAATLSLTPATRLSSASSKTTSSVPSSTANPSSSIITQPTSSATPQSDSVTPSQNTLSSTLRGGPSTTNPTATPSQNIGYYEYNAANTAFTAFSQLGGACSSQNSISFVAFRQHTTQFYLTPNTYYLTLMQNSSPNQQQLFTAIQNIDCTWSFRSYDGLYISFNTIFSYLTLSNVLSTGERFYLERKQDWIYVESAFSYRYFWVANNGIVMMNMNSASRFVMQVWPNLNAGWN